MKLSYKEIKNLSPEKARQIIKDKLFKNNWNISLTAKQFNIDRKTVRRARDWPLLDISKKPKSHPKTISTTLSDLIIECAKKTWFRYKRLHNYIFNLYKITIPSNTIRKVLKRNNIFIKKIRTYNKRVRPLYDYENLLPFAELQVDTKHVLDYNALPKEVYWHIVNNNLAKYEYNIIDACTKTRFTAYSYELSSIFWWTFIWMVINWLKAYWIRHHIHIQWDNWAEFCSWSQRKENELNDLLKPFNASFSAIAPWKHYKQWIIENSHRHDDEQFLSIHPIKCKNNAEFMIKAQQWQDTWNTARSSWWHWMLWRTPLQKLLSKNTMLSWSIMQFPTIMLEKTLNTIADTNFTSGEYVCNTYHYYG